MKICLLCLRNFINNSLSVFRNFKSTSPTRSKNTFKILKIHICLKWWKLNILSSKDCWSDRLFLSFLPLWWKTTKSSGKASFSKTSETLFQTNKMNPNWSVKSSNFKISCQIWESTKWVLSDINSLKAQSSQHFYKEEISTQKIWWQIFLTIVCKRKGIKNLKGCSC